METFAVLLVSPAPSDVFAPLQRVALQWRSSLFAATDACTLQLFAWRARDAACTNHTACAGR